MTIDGWECTELYPGTDYAMRTASRRSVSIEACADGIRIDESSSGFMGYSGTYNIPANLLMWLAQVVR